MRYDIVYIVLCSFQFSINQKDLANDHTLYDLHSITKFLKSRLQYCTILQFTFGHTSDTKARPTYIHTRYYIQYSLSLIWHSDTTLNKVSEKFSETKLRSQEACVLTPQWGTSCWISYGSQLSCNMTGVPNTPFDKMLSSPGSLQNQLGAYSVTVQYVISPKLLFLIEVFKLLR